MSTTTKQAKINFFGNLIEPPRDPAKVVFLWPRSKRETPRETFFEGRLAALERRGGGYTRDGWGGPGDSRDDGDISAAPETTAIELVRVTKDRGPLTKRISLGDDGKLVSDASQCQMARGVMERLRLVDWRDFAKLLDQTPRDVAYILGRLHGDIAESVKIVPKGKESADLGKGAPRCAETIFYRQGQPGLVLLDHDTKGMPAAVKDRLDALGGFLGAVEHLCPGLTAAGYIRRLSTSSGDIPHRHRRGIPEGRGARLCACRRRWRRQAVPLRAARPRLGRWPRLAHDKRLGRAAGAVDRRSQRVRWRAARLRGRARSRPAAGPAPPVAGAP